MARLTLERLDRRELPSAAMLLDGTAIPNEPPATVRGEDHPGAMNDSASLLGLPYFERGHLRNATAGSGVGLGITAPLGSTKGSLHGLSIEPEDVPG
jgi:hypothetical protein